jgi:hypothetical protein
MSLDNIQLPRFLCPLMYKKYLVDLSKKENIQGAKKQDGIDFLGGNKERILFVTSDSQHKFLADDQMKFMNDLLNACNLTMADIAFVNIYEHNSLSYQDLHAQFSTKKILLLGVSARQLGLPFEIPLFQVQNFQNLPFILCPRLEEIQLNRELKRQLWNSLQKIFNIQKQK